MKKSSSKKLTEMIQKWRRRKKGHFAVYTREGRRFLVPINYLNHPIFQVLLEMAEEEFGTTIHGPLQVPCEEGFMGYIISLLSKNHLEETDKGMISMNKCKDASISSFFPIFHHRQNLVL